MSDFMHEITDLLEQGRTIVAKKGDKADPEDLAMAVLHYCEGAGYTVDEVFETSNHIREAAWDVRDEKCKELKFFCTKKAEE